MSMALFSLDAGVLGRWRLVLGLLSVVGLVDDVLGRAVVVLPVLLAVAAVLVAPADLEKEQINGT